MLFEALRIELFRRKMTYAYVGKRLGRGDTYVNLRMNGEYSWRAADMYCILRILGEPDEKLHTYFPMRDIMSAKDIRDTAKAILKKGA